MIRLIINKRLVQIALFPFFGLKNAHDIESDKKLDDITPTRLTIDKIKDFFYNNGETSKEFQSILNSTTVGFVAGFFMGGIHKSRFVAEKFITENEATPFKNHYEAKRLLQYKVATALFHGGFPFAMKLGTFCFLFSTTATVLQTHQGKFNPSQHVIAGAIAGSIYKMNTGLKGAFAGGFVGTILGSISGIAAALILYVTGTEMDDLVGASNSWISKRRNLLKEQTIFMNEEAKMFREVYDENQNMRKTVYGDEKERK
ncbi:RPII140-upstream gene protein [Megachile rotundata]|uniref:RPII140-upstream gene protein n=1 Tax=Megachile rotundata TaxID=143995 RepID=UPI000258DDDC|nr:PREDICTED: RPII140-upstream gene protein [Megachile rotundata]